VSQVAPGAIVALVTHARHVPAVERGRFAAGLREELPGRAFVLETCHRAEVYIVTADDPGGLALAAGLPAGGGLLVGEPAVRHAIAVAVGRDSVVVGEDQILHQVRDVVRTAGRGGVDPILGRLFGRALGAGRRARSWRQGPPRSLADIALSAIEHRAGQLRGRDVLVVGAGQMGRLAARATAASGATVWIANRSPGRAAAIATQTGGRVEIFDPGSRIDRFAGVIVALSGPWTVGRSTIETLVRGSTVVVDLSVPPAVAEPVAARLGTRFLSADALAFTDAEPETLHGGAVARLDALVDATTAEFIDWLERRDGRAAAQALVAHADRQRQAELAALWRQLPDLQPGDRDAIDRMTRHLAARLLREPLERLAGDSDGGEGRAVRDLFGL
jgi:glutamyl-tRNA reductase